MMVPICKPCKSSNKKGFSSRTMIFLPFLVIWCYLDHIHVYIRDSHSICCSFIRVIISFLVDHSFTIFPNKRIMQTTQGKEMVRKLLSHRKGFVSCPDSGMTIIHDVSSCWEFFLGARKCRRLLLLYACSRRKGGGGRRLRRRYSIECNEYPSVGITRWCDPLEANDSFLRINYIHIYIFTDAVVY